MKLFSKDYTKEEESLFAFLRTIPLFSNFNNHELFLCCESIHLRNYKLKEVIFFQEDPAQALYIIKSGSVTIEIEHEGKAEVLKPFAEGESFGHESLLKKPKRFASANCTSEFAEIYVIPRVHLEYLSKKDARLKAKLYENLANFYGDYVSAIYQSYQQSFGLFELSSASTI